MARRRKRANCNDFLGNSKSKLMITRQDKWVSKCYIIQQLPKPKSMKECFILDWKIRNNLIKFQGWKQLKQMNTTSTCFLHNVHRPLDSCSLLQIFEKLMLCLTNLLPSDAELYDGSSLSLVTALFRVRFSLPSASDQAKYTCRWLDGTYKISHR